MGLPFPACSALQIPLPSRGSPSLSLTGTGLDLSLRWKETLPRKHGESEEEREPDIPCTVNQRNREIRTSAPGQSTLRAGLCVKGNESWRRRCHPLHPKTRLDRKGGSHCVIRHSDAEPKDGCRGGDDKPVDPLPFPHRHP
ncbi:hypothetical protein AAFF_G00035210 [Aldrovandia affinis]|uniref:Uncharacterized protein n=1 Tax=Aldrovandia affinis TaxID=143900 RepID=A0AAD7S2Z5_9TELE|nr:hypothetical protein AAFF_G00035210 [Aldrovandia affinis]